MVARALTVLGLLFAMVVMLLGIAQVSALQVQGQELAGALGTLFGTFTPMMMFLFGGLLLGTLVAVSMWAVKEALR